MPAPVVRDDPEAVLQEERHSTLAISRDAGDGTPETLQVRLTGQMRHGQVETRWLAPRR